MFMHFNFVYSKYYMIYFDVIQCYVAGISFDFAG